MEIRRFPRTITPSQQPELTLVSIVTPSYNKGRFIEETILSVINQTYPRIEYIVVDGGSTDGTLDRLRKHSSSLTWISETDEGQSDAINKGWRMTRGEIIAYLNADDTYLPWTVEKAVESFLEHPDVSMVYGDCNIIDEHGQVTGKIITQEFNLRDALCDRWGFAQPTVFFKRHVLDVVGHLDTNLHMSMDFDLCLRIGLKFKTMRFPQFLANFRMCPGTKSVEQPHKFAIEHLRILDKIYSQPEYGNAINKFRREAYSYAHLRAGIGYHSQRQMKLSLIHLAKAIRMYPRHLREPLIWGYWLTAFMGRDATDILVQLKSRMRSLKKPPISSGS